MGARIDEVAKGSKVRLAFTPKISDFRGYPEVEFEIKDLRR